MKKKLVKKIDHYKWNEPINIQIIELRSNIYILQQ